MAILNSQMQRGFCFCPVTRTSQIKALPKRHRHCFFRQKLTRHLVSQPSAQHRVAAWRGAVQMIRDHPLGVGWNQAVGIYDRHYLPPEGGAAAITMNSYLMLGTELGLPGLLWFCGVCGTSF